MDPRYASTRLVPRPRSALRHWSTYATLGEWYADYAGHVPVQAAAAIGRHMRDTGLSFPDAYRSLIRARRIVHLDPSVDLEAPW